MSERKAKALRKARREALKHTPAILFEEAMAGVTEAADAARENMARAQRRNVERIRAEFGGKVAEAALAKGRAERRRYLRDQRKKGMSHGRG